MAITGLFLITFLVIHAGINACIWANDHGLMFNRAAHFMATTVVIRIMEWVLFVGFLVHIIQGLALEVQNRSRRGKGYAKPVGNKASRWYSRAMGLLGTLILLFLVLHLSHFWVVSRFGHLEEFTVGADKFDNLYARMVTIFQSPVVVIIYVLGCISLGYHLAHGFQSAFRTLGVHNGRYLVLLKNLGFAYSILISLAFALMPVSIYFKWINV